jgi:3-phosphoshikimate 1-carboxyvinyltransferase
MTAVAGRDWVTATGSALAGVLRVPGDKSVSHRAIIFAALAEGVSTIDGFLEGADTLATQAIFRELGVRIDAPGTSQRIVHGVGLHGLQPPTRPLDCGNAGTAMRLLAGLLSAQHFDSVLVGDASLSARPMRRVMEPLRRMGARIDSEDGQTPPLRIRGNERLRAIEFEPEVASAQLKSAVLLAGLYAQGDTVVREPHPTRDYTERMLSAFGWGVHVAPGEIRITGGQSLRARDVVVPGDFSSAAFFIVAATLLPGSDLQLESVGVSPRRTGLLNALRAMGADIVVENQRIRGGEPIADVRVRHARLHGIDVPEAWVPDMIDEIPVLAVAAACADGMTRIRGAAELRVKESDRIAAMAKGLQGLGSDIRETPDGATITGGTLNGGEVCSRGDHRVAMAFAVAGQLARGPVLVRDVANVDTSFPGFEQLARGAGFELRSA